jgi:hypothetical protein
MRLIDNWRAVLCRSYAVHFGALAFLFELCGTIGSYWSLFAGVLPMPPLVFAIVGLVFGILGLIGRFIHQQTVSGDTNEPS